MVELIEGFNLLARDHNIVKDQVVDQPVVHPPQYLWHVLDIVKDTPGGNCDVLYIILVKLNYICTSQGITEWQSLGSNAKKVLKVIWPARTSLKCNSKQVSGVPPLFWISPRFYPFHEHHESLLGWTLVFNNNIPGH